MIDLHVQKTSVLEMVFLDSDTRYSCTRPDPCQLAGDQACIRFTALSSAACLFAGIWTAVGLSSHEQLHELLDWFHNHTVGSDHCKKAKGFRSPLAHSDSCQWTKPVGSFTPRQHSDHG
jgi:hypothetical protein